MPWFQPQSNLRESEITLVRVISVTTLFPSRRSIKLIGLFGATASEQKQESQMIQRIEL